MYYTVVWRFRNGNTWCKEFSSEQAKDEFITGCELDTHPDVTTLAVITEGNGQRLTTYLKKEHTYA